MSDQDSARHAQLNALKLRALVRDHLGLDDVGEAEEFAPGSALVHDGAAWVLLDRRPADRLGAALAWSLRRDVTAVHVIAESGTGALARRAAGFERPVGVWHAEGRTLLPAVAEPLPALVEPDPGHLAFTDLICEGGAEPVVEHGVVVGEVRGLEVCRVVDDPHLGTTRLEVGVGAHDREAFQMLHGDVPPATSLARIVDEVEKHRRVGAPQHPLNRLAAERFLRWRLVDDPGTVGLAAVTPVEPPVPRANLKDAVPCAALGVDADGVRSIVVCTVGVDLEVLPYAIDAAGAIADRGEGDLPVTVVLPARDRVRVVDDLAGWMRRPVRVATVDPG